MKILILEDDPNRQKRFREQLAFFAEELCIVDKVKPCIDALKSKKWDCLFLDHDLGGKIFVQSDGVEPTGYQVAVWLEENPSFKPPRIVLHSLNKIGRDRMQMALPEAEDVPWAWEFIKTDTGDIRFVVPQLG